MDVDEAYQAIGGFGRWQQRMYMIVAGSWIPGAFQSLNPTFMLESPKWQCTHSGIADAYCSAGIKLGANDGYCTLPHGSYEFINPDSTAAVTFGLVCDDAWKKSLITSAYFIGFFIGNGYFGPQGDSKGRKPCFELIMLVLPFASFFTAISPNYIVLLVTRVVTGFFVGGCMTISYVYFNEFLGADYREIMGKCVLKRRYEFTVLCCHG
jgi:hypothetical protein